MGILVGRRLVAMPHVFHACNYFICASTYFSHTIEQRERSDKVNCMEHQFACSTEKKKKNKNIQTETVEYFLTR